jgi:UDP-4-amino-4,6-dideoxy-N-acetyl-beta-L-altrosamine transaminase
MIPYGKHEINKNDIDNVIEALKSGTITQGSFLNSFERSICDYTKAKFSVAVNSGTSALHISCMALGLSKGDLLWTSPITFVASANCGLYCGASIDFVDINPKSYNIDVDKLRDKLYKAKSNNTLPKIIIIVHFSGLSCEMKEIYDLSLEYGFSIIEDACHAIGGKYQDKPIGCSIYSSITVFSFHPVKLMTTGEGGIAVTNNEDIFLKMNLLRSHGITRDESNMEDPISKGDWYYQQIDLGFNYRMTDIQAALGISQLKRLDSNIKKRHLIAKRYNSLLCDMNVQLPVIESSNKFSALHLYVIRIKNKKSNKDIINSLRRNGVGAMLHYIPVHTQPYYKKLREKYENLDNSIDYYNEAITLPMHHQVTTDDQDKVVFELEKYLK